MALASSLLLRTDTGPLFLVLNKMVNSQRFDDIFLESSLRTIYFEEIRARAVPGIDRINRLTFESTLSLSLQMASRKARNGIYRFSPYKQNLILKGPESLPRKISIPTIRDKIVLRALLLFLQETVLPQLELTSVHRTVHEVKEAIKDSRVNYYVKLDVKDFYPSIDHSKLLTKVRRFVKDDRAMRLLRNAIEQETVPLDTRPVSRNTIGVPQGLSISNLLANLYLNDIDKKYRRSKRIKYFRYVDDILIICREKDAETYRSKLASDLAILGLCISDKKEMSGHFDQPFPYLGYTFKTLRTSVRSESITKLVGSLIDTFSQHKFSKKKALKILQWRLNLRTTGFRINKERYGWMFFFSQIDDMDLLFHLDHVVDTLTTRYKIDRKKFRRKRFVRAYHEIILNLNKTKYIPDFDNWTVAQKRSLLKDIFLNKEAGNMDDAEIENAFRNKVFLMIKELEKDIGSNS